MLKKSIFDKIRAVNRNELNIFFKQHFNAYFIIKQIEIYSKTEEAYNIQFKTLLQLGESGCKNSALSKST